MENGLKKYEYYRSKLGVLYHGDCLEILPWLEPVDIVLTDPPYGANKADWDISFPTDWYAMAKRVAKVLYIITGSCGLKDSILLVGDDFVDVISARNLNGMTRGPIGFGNWLAVVVACGKPKMGQNAFEFSIREPMPNFLCPKPIEFMLQIIQRVSTNSETILDPFFGSGSTGVACQRLNKKWIGIEKIEEHCDIAAKRIEKETQQLKLF